MSWQNYILKIVLFDVDVLGLIFKLGQLIEYLVRNILMEKVDRKHARKAVALPRFKDCIVLYCIVSYCIVLYFLTNFYFSPDASPSKTMEDVFISSKKLFLFSKYSNVFTSISPLFLLVSNCFRA